MKQVKKLLCVLLSFGVLFSAAGAENMFSNSDFVETEQPAISDETKRLIAAYRSEPCEENLINLRNEVISNYNAVLERKEEKLKSLREETAGKAGGDEIVAEMEEIVQDMYVTYWDRIGSTVLRFTDPRLLEWRIADAPEHEYIPVMGAGESIYIKRTTVTNAEYKEYIDATGAPSPSNWEDGEYPEGEDELPENFVSYYDALSYCDYLTEKDGENTYRLPTESEWELAAGHMPKDADFNCNTDGERSPVTEYASVTRGAHGAVDFWGNVWEWTSEETDGSDMEAKGGSYKSERTECRTENRKEKKEADEVFDDVGFRVIMVKDKKEPEEKAEIASLAAPEVKAVSDGQEGITLSWNSVEGAEEYQIFEYFEDTRHVKMLGMTAGNTAEVSDNGNGYIVQAVGYTSISDHVSEKYAVRPGGDGAKEWIKSVRTAFKSDSEEDIRLILSELSQAKGELGDDSVDIMVNGEFIDWEEYDGVGPVIEDGRTLVPLRTVSENLGAVVDWDEKAKSIAVTYEDMFIKMAVDIGEAYVDGDEIVLDTPPVIVNGRTLVPLRFVAESMGLHVEWEPESRTVIIK